MLILLTLGTGIANSAPNLEGVTGILNIPTAESAEDGEVFFGFGLNRNRDKFFGRTQRNYFAGVGYLPGLEISGRYIDFPQIEEKRVPGFGTRKDRSVNVKYQFVCESCHKISLAVGSYDVGGKARIESASYLVGTKTLGNIKLTMGTGTNRLAGVFYGMEFSPFDKVTVLYEHDRVDHNFGLRIKPAGNVNLLLGVANHKLAIGLSYQKDLVPPKGHEKPAKPKIKQLPISESADEESLERMASRLASLGFTNIIVKAKDDLLNVKYENRRFRLEEEAWATVLLWSSIYAPKEISRFRIVTRKEQQFIVVTEFNREDIFSFVNGEIGQADFARRIKVFDYEPPGYEFEKTTSLHNSSALTTDIYISPANKVNLGEFFEPVKHRTGLALSQKTSFGSGLSLQSRLEIPLINTLDKRDAPFMTQATLSMNKVFPESIYAMTSAGYFGEHRYGVKAEIRKFIQQSQFDMGIEGALVRDRYYDEDFEMGLFSVAGRHPLYDLTFRFSTGKFLLGDKGWMLETKRYLGSNEVAFFVYDTDATGTEAGVRFSIPLMGYQEGNASKVRFTPAPFFRYEYRTTSLGGADLVAPRLTVEEFRSRLFPLFLKEHVGLIRKMAFSGERGS